MALRLRVLTPCLVVLLLAIAGGIQAEEKGAEETEIKEEFVITLDHSNFTDTVSKHDFILVEFYAPWCGHCKSLAPEYEKAASILSKHDPPIPLAKVNADEDVNKDLSKQYGVKGFPTLKILRNGAKIVQEYKGPRKAEGIVEHVKKYLGPASVEIKSAEDAATIIGEKKVFIAGIFPKFSGEEYENFIKLADNLRSDYEFGHTLDAKFLPRGESSVSGPLIRLFKPFDELVVDFKDFDLEAAQKFIEKEDAPSVIAFDQQDATNIAYLSKAFESENAKVILVLNFSDENSAALKTKFSDIAYLLKGGNLSFVIGDLEPSQPLLKYFKLEESQVPLIFIQDSENKYLKANVELDQVVSWFKKYLDGKVEPHRVSEPIPLENNEPVKVVVLDSLQDMVFNSGKEVLLEFYAPWCGHCKNLAPILVEIAESYEKDPNVMIAKLDATANDVPSETFAVQGYPTMYFISSNGQIVEYNGDRTKEDIIEFIEKHRHVKSSKSEAKTESKPEPVEEKKEEPSSAKDEL